DVLPGAHVQAGRVQRVDEALVELGPVRAAVARLDEGRGDAVCLRLVGDGGQVAAVRLAHVPDPHAVPVDGRVRGGRLGRRGSRLPAIFTFPPGATVRASVQELMHFTQLMCGGRGRASLVAVTTSRAARTASDVPAARIPGSNNATGQGCGGVSVAVRSTGRT